MTDSIEKSRPGDLYRFDGWAVRPHERLLLVRGEPVKLGGRAFDLLLALIQLRGRIATKRELMDAGWPGLVVEENNLSVQIAALRKVLGPEAIANVAGLGYQLVAMAVGDLPSSSAGQPELRLSPDTAHILGRESDLDALNRLMEATRLVSVVGTGGVGKTTLARAVAAQQRGRWRDGVHWIDLGPVHSGERLLPLVAAALGVLAGDPAERDEDLERSLSQRHSLVVLDNCEHVLDDVATLLRPILSRAPDLRWLATSQEPLHMVGEAVFRLAPLEVPPPGTRCVEAKRYGAIALLCERIRSADRFFELTDERVEVAIDLCARLDGLPLALEMAAARIATLGLVDVHNQINQRLRLRAHIRDVPPRHHSLRQTFEWSYGLLTKLEKAVFRRLEPFVGGFTASLAQGLCSAPDAEMEPLDAWLVLDALSALVDKSLVQRTSTGHTERFHLLESAREFARLQLEVDGESMTARRRHAHAIAVAFDTAQRDVNSCRDAEWTAKWVPERRNLCEALACACQDGDPDILARLVSALAQMDALTLTYAEVVHYPVPLDRLRAAPAASRARARLSLGWAHFLDGNRELGTELALEALADFEGLSDGVGIYDALLRLVRLYNGRPGMEEPARATWARLQSMDDGHIPLRLRLVCQSTVALVFESDGDVERLKALEKIAREAGLDAQAAVCRLKITDELLLGARYDETAEIASAMLEAGEPMPRIRALIQHNLAHALVRLGRVADARAAAQATLRALPGYAHLAMDLFARVAAQEERPEDAALLAGCSAQIKGDRDLHPDASEIGMIEETRRQIEQTLGVDRVGALMRQGATKEVEDVLRLAWRT